MDDADAELLEAARLDPADPHPLDVPLHDVPWTRHALFDAYGERIDLDMHRVVHPLVVRDGDGQARLARRDDLVLRVGPGPRYWLVRPGGAPDA